MVVVRYSPDKHDLSALLKGYQPGGQLGTDASQELGSLSPASSTTTVTRLASR